MLSDNELAALREQLETTLKAKIKPRVIKAIHVNSAYHWQPPMWIEIGKRARNLERDSPSEEIIAIFESVSFMVCTATRGTAQTPPYFFAREDVRQVIYAD